MGPRLSIAWSCAAIACALPLAAAADDLTLPPAAVTRPRADAAGKPDAALSGEEIYQRVLDNTFDSFVQVSSLFSGDRRGTEQWSRFKMWFQNLRKDGEDVEAGTVTSKSLVRYTEPFDIRHSGYLILSRSEAVDDQFVYMPSQRRVKRVNLRGEAVFGSDFSFEDILPRDIEDADYVRLPDANALGRDCFVIEAAPNERARSEYSRMLVYVDKERSVPLLTRYWDDRGVEVKELRADPEAVERIDDVWIATRMTMRNLKFESYTRLEVSSIQANASVSPSTFEVRRLESHGR